MNKSKFFYAIIVMMMIFSMNAFGQERECDKYLNQQTSAVNTKAVVLRVLGKTADVFLGTNFSSLTRSTGELQMLDNIQYETCMKLQTVKNEFSRENLETKVEQTLNEMVKLINQSGELPPDAVKQLIARGILNPSQATTIPATTKQETSTTVTNADDVIVPILPTPPAGSWNTVTFPCQTGAMSSAGIIRARGMESSMDPQIAKSVANVIALEELASKIEVTVKSTTQYFITQTKTNLSEELNSRFERKIDVSVNQTIRGYKNICEEYRQHSETQKYQCFVALEINEDTVLKPVHEELQQEPELRKAMPNYEKFKAVFNEALNFYEKTGI
jgi:hypothetical protein